MQEDIDRAEIESERIRGGACPKCGERVKDKGSYVRCYKCPWMLTEGTWSDEGYVIDKSGSK